MLRLCDRLYPLCRSITGEGVRETLAILSEFVELDTVEVPSGTQVFDWTIPAEWNIKDAYVANSNGERVIDFKRNSLHVVSYSEPVRERLGLSELQERLHSMPDRADWIPYRTSYYDKSWGFCLEDRCRQLLEPGEYEVVIDSSLTDGALTYAECFIPGLSDEELLISTHICHPSLANDNLSGIAVASHLARHFATQADLYYGLRFVFIPATIGSITWLARNEDRLGNIVGGFVVTGVGDRGQVTYKRSRNGSSTIDRTFLKLLTERDNDHTIRPFGPYGYDERQYCSPGINLPIGCVMRTPFGEYAEYHTSGDNLEFISEESLGDTFELCADVISDFQRVRSYQNLRPNGEPQLGRYGLYEAMGGDNEESISQMALLWMLNYSDGSHSTLDISDASGFSLGSLDRAANLLVEAGLLAPLPLSRVAHAQRTDYEATS